MQRRISPVNKTALRDALSDGDLASVKRELEKYLTLEQRLGALLYVTRENRDELIDIAAKHSHQHILDYIYNDIAKPFFGNDINKSHNTGFNLFHLSVYCNQPKEIVRLIDKGFDPNKKAITSLGAMNIAVIANNKALIDLLEEYGANPRTPDVTGKNVLGDAREHNLSNIEEYQASLEQEKEPKQSIGSTLYNLLPSIPSISGLFSRTSARREAVFLTLGEPEEDASPKPGQ